MFSADAALKAGAGFATPLHSVLNQLTHTIFVDGLEWINRQDLVVQVILEESADIIPAVPEGHLGQIIGSETEELSRFSYFTGS